MMRPVASLAARAARAWIVAATLDLMVVAAVASMAGCGGLDPCSGQTGACVGIVATGSVGSVDSLHFELNGTVTHAFTAAIPDGPRSLPIGVPVLIPDGRSGTVIVAAVASLAGKPVGAGVASAFLDGSGRVRIEVALASSTSVSCSDGMRNGTESDADCGGTCGPCPDGKTCNSEADCASHVCTAFQCAAPTCMDQRRNGTETDVDCGGGCPACADRLHCATSSDCRSGYCDATAQMCLAPSCTDHVQNQGESDVDCGGMCAGCAPGGRCNGDADCASQVCDPNRRTCSAPSCSDGKANGQETDVDCGGDPSGTTCGKCAAGRKCQLATDCDSGVCDGTHKCAVPTCTDHVQNGDESDVDCGGTVCKPCALNLTCATNSDCLSTLCIKMKCAMPTCVDGVQNGTETDTDCGGNTCPACVAGKHCGTRMDCASYVCTNMTCQMPSCTDGVQNGAETATDCGGGLCPACANTKACKTTSDCVSGNCQRGFCAPLFATASLKSPSSGPVRTLEVADIDGSGVPDVVASIATTTVGVATLIGDGTGYFKQASSFLVGSTYPTSLALFPWSGIKHVDLVAVNNRASSAYVYVNDGKGNFMPIPAAVPAGMSPISVAATDFNLDGNGDFAVANQSSSNITVGYGSSGTNFQSFATKTSGPRALTAFDQNGDSYPDLAVASSTVVEVYLSTKGSFANTTSSGAYTVGMCPDQLVAADLNNDKLNDLVVASSCDQSVSVLMAQANAPGPFKSSYLVAKSAGLALAVADLNGDGRADLVTNGASSLLVLLGNGDGTFQPGIAYDSGGSPPTVVRVADMNGDGRPDLVHAPGGSVGGLYVLLNNK